MMKNVKYNPPKRIHKYKYNNLKGLVRVKDISSVSGRHQARMVIRKRTAS